MNEQSSNAARLAAYQTLIQRFDDASKEYGDAVAVYRHNSGQVRIIAEPDEEQTALRRLESLSCEAIEALASVGIDVPQGKKIFPSMEHIFDAPRFV